jgi:hypothetical protein
LLKLKVGATREVSLHPSFIPEAISWRKEFLHYVMAGLDLT